MKPPSLKSPPKLPQLQYSLIDSNPDANMQKPEPNMIGELLEVKIESPEEIKTKTSDPKHKYIEYGVRQTWWPQDRSWPPTWVPKRPDNPCRRFTPNYVCIIAFLMHSPAWLLVYGGDTDPTFFAFIGYQTAILLGVISLMALVLLDPGIVPPNMDAVMADYSQATKIEVTSITEDTPEEELYPLEYFGGMSPIMRNIDGSDCRWCCTCKHWRKPGTVHCGTCGFCIAKYDHHCGVMGHCIGAKNHRFFVLLFVAIAFTALFGFIGCVMRADRLRRDDDMWKNWNWYFAIMASFYTGVISLSVGPMALAMLTSSATGRTMDNVAHLSKAERDALLKECWKTCCQNLLSFWCTPFSCFRRSSHPFGYYRGYMRCH
eukprot:m.167740 g.167740  ORF g.167740 m.167740 type:complete len:374 (-) comp15308_c0_seq13:1730-2851(-)